MEELKIGDLQRITEHDVFDIICEIIDINDEDGVCVREVFIFYDNESDKENYEWNYYEEKTDYKFKNLGDKNFYPEYYL